MFSFSHLVILWLQQAAHPFSLWQEVINSAFLKETIIPKAFHYLNSFVFFFHLLTLTMINLQVCSFNYILKLLFLLIIFLLTIYGDCTCDDVGNTKNDNSTALKYKLGSIASILVASAVGVSIPLLGKKLRALRPENDFFFIIEAFAAGVILVTGFNHVLPDAFVRLTSPCLNQNPWGTFPFKVSLLWCHLLEHLWWTRMPLAIITGCTLTNR